ncbi:carcinoembryonic antigen-related cell adhesion molecule 3-like isoform X2 [Hemicordylus capensis]|uniref:carcinoembryonic antigen-related cell adhesion molecule 3-like isoform X2 n=1 Tax=Hemicordylus capensis TaxID=884348 RepID=UPI00230418B4|nr:carcinoembryonic antigen-related cell adhesion molecule 3-like isoform X2 [Hemicordylus capensis]
MIPSKYISIMDQVRCNSGWKISWRGLLLAASVLSSCFLHAPAQIAPTSAIHITMEPEHPVPGGSITLRPGGATDQFMSCSWYQGRSPHSRKLILIHYLPPFNGQTYGEGYSGRETAGLGCALRVNNLTSSDSGTYTMIKKGPGVPFEMGQVDIKIGFFSDG